MAQTDNPVIAREVELRKKLCDAQYGEIYTEAEYDGSPVTAFIAPLGRPHSLGEVNSFSVSCPEVGESFSLTNLRSVAKLMNNFDTVIHDRKGIEMAVDKMEKGTAELVEFRKEHIDGHTQAQWDLVEKLANARVRDANDPYEWEHYGDDTDADPKNKEWDMSLATEKLELPTSVAQDLVTFQNDIVHYEQLYKDTYGVSAPESYDVSPIEREDKLFGGLHASEYAEAYSKEHAPQEPEMSAEDGPDFVVDKKDVTSFSKTSSYGITIPYRASPYGSAKVYVNSSEIKELEDGREVFMAG